MEAPPFTLDYYAWMSPTTTNPGTQGMAFAWDDLKRFWGGVVNEAWNDLQAIIDS